MRKPLTPPETGARLCAEPNDGSPPPLVRPFHLSQALRADPDADPDLLLDLAVLLKYPNHVLTPQEQRFLLGYAAGWSARQAFQRAGLQGNSAREFRRVLQRVADWMNQDE